MATASANDRHSFRRILITRLGLTIAVALAVITMLMWLLAIVWTSNEVLVPLNAEASHVAELLMEDGLEATDRYDWHEPHHRFASERIDPFFLQVFDVDGRIVRASENIGLLDASYPMVLLARIAPRRSFWLARPVRFSVGTDRLYGTVQPILTANGDVIGAVQVARFDIGQEAAINRLGIGLVVAYVVVLLILLGLLDISGRRVLRPLETLTMETAALGTTAHANAISVPESSDRETADLARTINGALARIDESFEEVRRFTADAAHELQTPLAILKGHVEVALRRDRESDYYRETLATLEEEVDSMSTLVRALLDLARLDSHSSVREAFVLIDLNELIQEEAERVRDDGKLKSVSISTSYVTSATVLGEPNLVRQAIRNVLENAIKYSQAGTLSILTRCLNGNVCIQVQDSGIGIRAEDIDRVTERFFRASDVRDIEGHGLGLALVSAILKRHGGSISLQSDERSGTTVDMFLPLESCQP